VFLRNRLKYALTYDEVKKIVNQRLVKVDGKVRTDKTYPAGFMGPHFYWLIIRRNFCVMSHGLNRFFYMTLAITRRLFIYLSVGLLAGSEIKLQVDLAEILTEGLG